MEQFRQHRGIGHIRRSHYRRVGDLGLARVVKNLKRFEKAWFPVS
jgi:hypothetical protein